MWSFSPIFCTDLKDLFSPQLLACPVSHPRKCEAGLTLYWQKKWKILQLELKIRKKLELKNYMYHQCQNKFTSYKLLNKNISKALQLMIITEVLTIAVKISVLHKDTMNSENDNFRYWEP